MDAALSPENQRWIVRYSAPTQTRLRLFCFPYAGGGASLFRTWAAALPDVEVLAVQLPGRERRLHEEPFTRLNTLVVTLAEVLEPLLTPPFSFFGHSMGALISFEFARYLRTRGMPLPQQLLVSGRRAPQLVDPDPPVHTLPAHAFVDRLRELNGTPEEVLTNPDLVAFVMPLLRADFALHETYTYVDAPPLDVPITAFGGAADPKVSRSDLFAWRMQTCNSFGVHMFAGDHFFLHSAQTALLAILSNEMSHRLMRSS